MKRKIILWIGGALFVVGTIVGIQSCGKTGGFGVGGNFTVYGAGQ